MPQYGIDEEKRLASADRQRRTREEREERYRIMGEVHYPRDPIPAEALKPSGGFVRPSLRAPWKDRGLLQSY